MKFVILIDYTDEALKGFSDLGDRVEQGRQLIAGMGGTLESFHLTTGAHDAIAIVDMPDAASMATLALQYAASGRLRTETLLAWDEAEAASIAASLSG